MKNDRPRNARLHAVAALMTLTLAACGGGGGGGGGTEPPPPPTALELATEFLASYDQSVATSVPATGAERVALIDKCFPQDGVTSDFRWPRYDETGAAAPRSTYSRDNLLRYWARNARTSRCSPTARPRTPTARRGARSTCSTTSPMPTARPISAPTDADHRQFVGLVRDAAGQQCDALLRQPKVESTRRSLARNLETINIQPQRRQPEDADGGQSARSALPIPRSGQGRDLHHRDRAGPEVGPSGKPFSLKMLSPRILRDAPELQGKPGNANFIRYRWVSGLH